MQVLGGLGKAVSAPEQTSASEHHHFHELYSVHQALIPVPAGPAMFDNPY